MAKSQSASTKPSVLSQVSKRGHEAIAQIMAERGGKMPLPQFLAARWNIENYFRSVGLS